MGPRQTIAVVSSTRKPIDMTAIPCTAMGFKIRPSTSGLRLMPKSRGTDDTPAKVARAMEEVEAIRTRWPAWAVRDPYYNPNLTADAVDFGFRL